MTDRNDPLVVTRRLSDQSGVTLAQARACIQCELEREGVDSSAMSTRYAALQHAVAAMDALLVVERREQDSPAINELREAVLVRMCGCYGTKARQVDEETTDRLIAAVRVERREPDWTRCAHHPQADHELLCFECNPTLKDELRVERRETDAQDQDQARLAPASALAPENLTHAATTEAVSDDWAIQLTTRWHPIATAPRDGTRVICCGAELLPCECEYRPERPGFGEDEGWYRSNQSPRVYPFAWMPLPPAPIVEEPQPHRVDTRIARDQSEAQKENSHFISLSLGEGTTQEQQWQPIETAPKDGNIVGDLWCVHDGRAWRMCDAFWFEQQGQWYSQRGNRVLPEWVTHWMPLPKGPKD